MPLSLIFFVRVGNPARGPRVRYPVTTRSDRHLERTTWLQRRQAAADDVGGALPRAQRHRRGHTPPPTRRGSSPLPGDQERGQGRRRLHGADNSSGTKAGPSSGPRRRRNTCAARPAFCLLFTEQQACQQVGGQHPCRRVLLGRSKPCSQVYDVSSPHLDLGPFKKETRLSPKF